jgi:gliding motility-associated lipoprotein GldH
LTFAACVSQNNYEKHFNISESGWNSDDIKEFSFVVNDTSKKYYSFLYLQHKYDYLFSNIWVKIYTQYPDGHQDTSQNIELMLSLPDGKWLGATANGIAQEKINLNSNSGSRVFKQKGKYTIGIQHIMRANPLKDVMKIGYGLENALPYLTNTPP